MPTDTFLGLRATNDFTVNGQRPEDWRTGILLLYPNGRAPLTALTALMKSEITRDPRFHWFDRIFAEQSGPIKGIYTDEAMATEATGAQTAQTVLYVNLEEVYARYFKIGHVVLLRAESDPSMDTVGLVQDISLTGATSRLTVRLLQDVTLVAAPAPTAITRMLVIGSAHAEGALIPDSIQYDPTEHSNYTQIFRNSLEITRTANHTYLRTGDAYKQMKKDTLEMHSVEMEKAFIWGVPAEIQGVNGKPLRTTGGLINAIKTEGGLQASFPGTGNQDWEDEGTDWFEEQLMTCFNYGSQEKLAFAGNAALLAINRLARKWGKWTYTPQVRAYGLNVYEYVTPFGMITVKTHPLMSQEPTNQKSMIIFEPKNVKYRYITDTTFFKDDTQHGAYRYDGLKEEYLTEAGMEFHHPKSWAYLNNIGG